MTNTLREESLIQALEAVKAFEIDHKLGSGFNIFDAIGMRTQEIRHSKFLAFLLDPSAPHGLGDQFLRAFLDYVMSLYDTPPVSRLSLLLADLSASEIYTERDHFDITIWLPEQKLLVVVENKIAASEGDNQLAQYRQRVKARYPEDAFSGVFLTVDGYDGDDSEWVAVSYRTVAEILQAMLQEGQANVDQDVRITVEHYLQLIGKHIVGEEKLIDACKRIYSRHRTAIDLIIEHGQVSLLQEACKQLLETERQLNGVRGSNRRRVNLVFKPWTEVPAAQVADVTRWGQDCPLQVWFQMDEERSQLSFVLEVGPVRDGTLFDREALVIGLRKAMESQGTRAIKGIYTRIARSTTKIDADDIDSIVNAMRLLWKQFVANDRLTRIESAIVEAIRTGTSAKEEHTETQ